MKFNMNKENQKPQQNNTPPRRNITNVFVEVEGKLIPIKELPKSDYEYFLDKIHALRLAYISISTR